jgi:phosphatidylserine decarboxylase
MESSLRSNEAVKPVTDLTLAERLNFLLTNRIPRRALTRFMGWFSRIENPLVRRASMAVWQRSVHDLRLHEAKKREFASLHECFIRELKPGARPIDPDPDVLVSPCDAVVGEFGNVEAGSVIQAKGFPYAVAELLASDVHARRYQDGRFVTLRLKSSMYHHFHAPCAGRIGAVRYISGDTWNVNPIALQVIERLFCRNERAVIEIDTGQLREAVTLVPVAAILVASMRLTCIDEPLNLQYRGPNRIPCDMTPSKGEELGYFEHGSTIVMFTTGNFAFVDTLTRGEVIRMGQPIMRRMGAAAKIRNIHDNDR